MSLTDDLKIELKAKATGELAKMFEEIAEKHTRRMAGLKPVRMAHLVSPWRFGTVIQPTEHPGAPWHIGSRHMVIGPLSSDPTNAIIALDVTADSPTFVAHLSEGLTDRWEPVPETDD